MARPTRRKGKKKWIQIVAPIEFREKKLGEIPTYDVNSLVGKKLKVNLMNVIGSPRKQNVNLVFRISKFDGVAKTDLVGYELGRAYLKRMVRKNSKKLEDSLICETKDGKKIRIKPVLSAKGKPNKPALTAIRLRTREYLIKNLKKQSYQDIFNSIINKRLQKEVIYSVKKIHPVTSCEFRIVEKVFEKS